MPNREFQVGDTTYEFPESYSDQQVQEILSKQGVIKRKPQQEPGLLKTLGKQAVGMGKELLTQGENFADIGTFGLKPLIESKIAPLGKARAEREKAIAPKGTEEKTGAGLLQVGEMLAPIPGLSKLEAAKGAGMAAKAGVAALRGAADVGLKTAVQTGDAKQAGLAALIGGATSAALEPILGGIGRKIQASTIRPRAVDMKDGFKWSTLDKFKLKGNLQQSLDQVDGKLTELRNLRNAELLPGKATVDLAKPLKEAAAEIKSEVQNLKHAGEGSKIAEAMDALQQDILDSLPGKNPQVDIRVAENAKEHLGMLGAWANGKPDREAQVAEQVANKLYLKVKDSIEKSLAGAGPKVKALNKQMQELIPIKNAMIARLPVEERNRLFSLQDIVTMLPAALGEPHSLALTGLSMAQKSLRFGNWLERNKGTITRVGSEVLGSAPRAVEQ